MRKAAFLTVFIGILCVTCNVFASNCESYKTGDFIFGCDTEDQGGKDYEYGTYIQTVGTGWCLTDDNKKGTEYTNGRFKCIDKDGADDAWTSMGTKYCSDSPIKANRVDNAEYCVLKSSGNLSSAVCVPTWSSWDGSNGWSGESACLYITCNDGFVAKGNACVEDTSKADATAEENACIDSGGTWSPGPRPCSCNYETRGLVNTDSNFKTCKCNDSNLEYNRGLAKCVVPGTSRTATEQADYNRSQQNAANYERQENTNKQTCEASGGKYSSRKCSCTAANTQVVSGKCECISGYTWINESNKGEGCRPTNTTVHKQACEAAAAKGQAQWQSYPYPGQCKCNESGYILDENAGECKPNPERAICQPLINANKARWDNVTETCVCSQSGYSLENGECVETEEAATARKDKEMKSAKNKIEDVHSKLKRVQDGFKVSAWKNEEGKFNTARLASDSIAGVVLGTAGGLVTSKVVKKNQVENGFEDIQCTIGGQAVAQWGDDFSVGTQF